MAVPTPPEQLAVLLVDAHRRLRAVVRSVIEAEPGLTVVGEAEDGLGALQALRERAAHVMLVDAGVVASGRSPTLEHLLAAARGTRVFVMGLDDHPGHDAAVRTAGGHGYLLKDAADRILDAIRSTHAAPLASGV